MPRMPTKIMQDHLGISIIDLLKNKKSLIMIDG